MSTSNKKCAVLVIDVQRGLCQGAEAAFDADGVIDRINLVTSKARRANLPVVLIQHESNGGSLQHGTDGWQLAEKLVVQPTDTLLRKTATDSFHKTDLHSILQQFGVESLVICGFQSDFCVDTTTRRALALGYPVTLVSDGHSTVDNELLSAAIISQHHNITLANITSFGPRATPRTASQVRFEA